MIFSTYMETTGYNRPNMKNNKMNRRNFFRYVGYGSAGAMVIPSFFTACNFSLNDHNDSYVNFEGIMPVAIVTDCSRLLLATESLNDGIREMLKADINQSIPGNLSRLGSSIPFDDETVLTAFQQLRKKLDPGSETQKKKISLLLGWLMFHPLRKEMTRIFSKLVDQGYHYDTIRIFYDTYIFRQVSGSQDTGNLTKENATNFFRAMHPRMVTRLHTLKPEYNDGPGWVVKMSEWRRNNHELTGLYGSFLVKPDQEMYNRFFKRYNVYDPQDQLIMLVNNMKQQISSGKVEKLILSDPGNSIYARSLVDGYKNVVSAQEFLNGKIDIENLKQRL